MVSAPRFTLLFLLAGAGWLLAAQSKPTRAGNFAGASKAEAGKTAFIASCSGCHGLDATGGDRAPGISAGSDAAKSTDEDLKRVIKNGIAGAGMPPFASLGDTQISQIVAYLRDLQGKAGTQKMPGDPQAGAALFFGKAGCAQCHMAAGKGGFLASDLTGYGETRTPAEIRRAITLPGKDRDDRTREAEVETNDGKMLKGVVRTEDNFSLALQTSEGKFLLLSKADIKNISYNAEPLMPSDYGIALSRRELDDLVSYLMQLRRNVDPAASQKVTHRAWEDD